MYGQWNRTMTDNRAFTLAEMMLTLGMMGILMSAGIVAASDMLRNARQATLDAAARTLYLSAQMGLTAAKLSGKSINVGELPPTVETVRSKLTFAQNEDGALKAELSDAPSSDVQLWKTDEAAQDLQDVLFPRISERGVRSVSAELFNGYWIVTFDPYAFNVVSVYFSRNDGGNAVAYFQDLRDDANREERLSELTLVENRLKDGALIGYYGPERAALSADMPFVWIMNDASETGEATADASETEMTPANNPQRADNLSCKMYFWIGYDENQDAPILNGETLVTRLNCWIPADSAFEIGNRPADVNFTLTVTGASSGKSETFRYRMEHYGTQTLCRNLETSAPAFASDEFCRTEEREAMDADGQSVAVSGWRYSYPVILDSPLDDGEGVLLHESRPFKARFPDFIPGEDILLQFEADVDENIRKAAKQDALNALSDGEKAAYKIDRISEQAIIDDESGAYDWLWKSQSPDWNERPVCNSLFADTDGLSTAKIACARHLRNLDAEISGFGASPDGIATPVRALQVADIGLADAFAPIVNGNLTEYDGGGCRIDNLQIDLTGHDAEGAGLFSVLSGSVTLKNLTLTNPIVFADNASGVGTLVGKVDADSSVKFSSITIINPIIRAGSASGVGGLIGSADAGSLITVSSVQLYMSPERYGGVGLLDVLDKWLVGGECVGGLIGCAAGDVTIDDADGVPTFAATVVNASAYAGGLAGYVAGKLNVSGAWADCYLQSGSCVGGLAGYCGPDSAFQRCYAAGFVVGAETAAGFAPCDAASVADAYSILNFGDLPLTKCGLCRDASFVSNAYFTYGGEVAGSVGAEIDGETLKTALSAESGFRIGETPAAPYGLTDTQSNAVYPYPALGGTHYNDYLVLERPAPTELEIIVELAFSDTESGALRPEPAFAYALNADVWNSADDFRKALSVAPIAPEQTGRAALKISATPGTTLRQNLDGLTFEDFALDESNSTLDKVIRQNQGALQDGDIFRLSYVRVYGDPQNDEMSSERTAETWGAEP